MRRAGTCIDRVSAGFTLIEMMLAVAILALILVMLAGSFHAVATGKVQRVISRSIRPRVRSWRRWPTKFAVPCKLRCFQAACC